MKRLLLIISCSLIFLSKNYACSCADQGPFFENQYIKAFGINCIAVLDSLSFAYQYHQLPSQTGHFTVLDTLNNIKTMIGSSIIVHGQDGLNCGANVHQLAVGDTFLLQISDGFYESFEKDTFYLDGCGKFYLNTKDESISGLTFTEIRQKMKEFTTSIDEKIIAKEILLFPNPSSNNLRFNSKIYPITSIQLFNLQGQELLHLAGLKSNNLEIIVADYPSGIYHIAIGTKQGFVYKKFIKE